LPLAALIAPLACGNQPDSGPPLVAYQRPAARPLPADPSCEGILASRAGARWFEAPLVIRMEAPGRLVFSDASALGGPHEMAIAVEVPAGEIPVRVVVEGQGDAARALCVQARLGEGAPAGWRVAGEVVIDTDMLVLGDEARLLRAIAAQKAPLVAAVDAPGGVIGTVVDALRADGLPMDRISGSFACGSAPLRPEDRGKVRKALKAANAPGAFVVEPRSPALAFLLALRESVAAPVEQVAGPRAAVAINAPGGDEAYSLRVGASAEGKALRIELPLISR
jgi:hypothetical protein